MESRVSGLIREEREERRERAMGKERGIIQGGSTWSAVPQSAVKRGNL